MPHPSPGPTHAVARTFLNRKEKRAPGATEFLGPKKRLIQQATDGGWWLNDKLWPVTASGRRLTDTGWPVTAGSWPLTGRPSQGTSVLSQEGEKNRGRPQRTSYVALPGHVGGTQSHVAKSCPPVISSVTNHLVVKRPPGLHSQTAKQTGYTCGSGPHIRCTGGGGAMSGQARGSTARGRQEARPQTPPGMH
jgi:hypothetical protein